MLSKEEYVAKHFPEVVTGFEPAGNKVLVQLRTVPKKHGMIELIHDTKDFNKHNTRVCRMIKIGDIAYRNRDTGERWKEGVWANPGDIIIMPAWGGFRFEVPIPGSDETAVFCTYKDFELEGRITENFESYDQLL